MKHSVRSVGVTLKTCLVVLAATLCTWNAQAALYTANYGNFSGISVNYIQVTESSGTDANALYNSPTVTGDTLNFNPTFTAFAEGAGGTDKTDGQLNFDINSHSGSFINKLMFSERGDFSLSGFSNDAYADVTASFFVEVTEVDGISINPVNASTTMTFSPNANGSFYLSDVGGASYDGLWSGDMAIDIENLLTTFSVPFVNGATKVSMVLDNKLTALSQAGTDAFIAKKDFQGFSVTAIPEPASLVLLIGTSSGLAFIRRIFIG